MSQLSCTNFLAEKIQQLKIAVIGAGACQQGNAHYFRAGRSGQRGCQPGAPGLQGLRRRRDG